MTLKESSIDLVVRGPGEIPLARLAEILRHKGNADGNEIRGVYYKDERNRIHGSFEIELPPLNDSALPAYHLIPHDKYHQAPYMRFLIPDRLASIPREISAVFTYRSSYGCSHNCAFCPVSNIWRGQYYTLSADKVLNDLEQMYNKYHMDFIGICDNNMFCDIPRIRHIARGLCDRQIHVHWGTGVSVLELAQLTDEDLRLLSRSGFVMAQIGAESGSSHGLRVLNKKIKPGDLVEQVIRLSAHGIICQLSYLFDYPGELAEDRWKTLQQIMLLNRLSENIRLLIFFYTPYPGNALFEKAVSKGFEAPTTLEEWGKVTHGRTGLRSMNDKSKQRLMTAARIANLYKCAKPHNYLRNQFVSLSKRILDWRLVRRTMSIPLDIDMAGIMIDRGWI
jgi:radical SAM superfamily enzyme YgiQ (UPF0313 family)